MTTLRFIAWWNGEPAAGFCPGSEEVTITFKYGMPIDEDVVAYWRDQVAAFYDGAVVEGGVVRS